MNYHLYIVYDSFFDTYSLRAVNEARDTLLMTSDAFEPRRLDIQKALMSIAMGGERLSIEFINTNGQVNWIVSPCTMKLNGEPV
jgi:hypothetical protein